MTMRRFHEPLHRVPALLLLPLFAAEAPSAAAQQETLGRVARVDVESVRSRAGVVVSETPLASEAGARMLERAGNAVDAAVATALALAVTWPEAGNLGGGGFLLVSPPDDEAVTVVDFRETAPAAATPTMFLEERTRFGPLQVGVPGSVAGLAAAHRRWGSLPWAALFEPAIELAEGGFSVNEALALSINEVLGKRIVRKNPDRFAELIRVYGKPGGGAWAEGDRLVLPDLAATLRAIAEEGPDAFYGGGFAQAMAAWMEEIGGLITAEDLAGYEALFRPAVVAAFFGHEVFGPPPPSAGGLTLAMELHQLAALPLTEEDRFAAPTLHRMAEAMRRAYHWRALTLGDPAFADVPAGLDAPVFGRLLATTIDPDHATPSASLSPEIPLADGGPETTHLSVVDAAGMAVSCTTTLEMSWGSRVIVPGTGVVLNNEMGDFNREPGVTGTTGQIGTPPNVIAPGKRMLSSMTPVIVKKDGRVVLVTGSPGGRTITNTVLNVLVSRLAYGMSVAESVEGPRLHHPWFPDEIEFEGADDPAFAGVVEDLRRRGHSVVDDGRQGSANTIGVDPASGIATGVADWRRGAAAASPEPLAAGAFVEPATVPTPRETIETEPAVPGFRWPLSGSGRPDYPLNNAFGPRQMTSEGYRYDFHRGLDLHCPVGTVVHAVADGRVFRAGDDPQYHDGVIVVRHEIDGERFNSFYAHPDTVLVQEGEEVEAGDPIGLSGVSKSGFPHLHFEIRRGKVDQGTRSTRCASCPTPTTAGRG